MVSVATLCMGQSCKFCHDLRHYTKNGWSSWDKRVPKNIKCESYESTVCNKKECIIKQQMLLS